MSVESIRFLWDVSLLNKYNLSEEEVIKEILNERKNDS